MRMTRLFRALLMAAAVWAGVPSAVVAQTPAHGAIGTPGEHRGSLVHGGITRLYRVHVPASIDPARAAPLLVALHGGGGNMDFQANDRFYGLISLAEREGVIVVFPNGYSRLPGGKLATWNAGACCGAARDAGVDDVGFIRALVGHLKAQLAVDAARVYATGMSNGAMMAYRLACEAPDVFSAIAAVAGTDNTRHCSPGRAVSVLHIHARNDDHVLFDGGAGPASVQASQITDYRSVPDTLARWRGLNGCTGPARLVFEQQGPTGASCERHEGCLDGSRVQLCVTETGGHSWPGGRKPRARSGATSPSLSANDVMWDFFNRR